LAGKILHQRNLLIGKGTDLLAVDADKADQLIALEHWYGDVGASAGQLHEGDKSRITPDVSVVGRGILDMDDLLRAS
jgi:hypothetical protein